MFFCLIFLALVISRARTLIIFYILIIFVLISTKAFYQLLFIRNTVFDKNSSCAVIVNNGGSIVESAMLISSARRLGIANIYALSMMSDTQLPAQLDDFFTKRQDIKYLGVGGLNDKNFRGCIFVYPPDLYCSISKIDNKYTLLPHEESSYVPSAEFLTINVKTIEHCASRIFGR